MPFSFCRNLLFVNFLSIPIMGTSLTSLKGLSKYAFYEVSVSYFLSIFCIFEKQVYFAPSESKPFIVNCAIHGRYPHTRSESTLSQVPIFSKALKWIFSFQLNLDPKTFKNSCLRFNPIWSDANSVQNYPLFMVHLLEQKISTDS